MESDFKDLYQTAKNLLNPRIVSPFIEAGGVASAIRTLSGNVYVGVCIDTSCTLGMCAERNAIANMITHGENKIDKLVCVMSDGSVGSPCGVCREFLMQLHKDSGEMRILTSIDGYQSVRLIDLIPEWWGDKYFESSQL